MQDASRMWHPWFGEAAIVLRRRAPRLSARFGLAALLATAGGGLALGVAQASGLSPSTVGALALAPLSHWPLQAAGLIAVGCHALIHARLLGVSGALRSGWWAAAPVDPRSHARALAVVAGGIAIVLLAASLLLVWLVAALGSTDASGIALAVVATGILGGSASGLGAALRRRRRPGHAYIRVGVRHPWFTLAWLDDRGLPHLSDWQRREALLRWRCGGGAAPMGAALLLIPNGTSWLVAVGVVVFVLSAAWLGVVLRGCIVSTAAASALLQSTPVSARSLAAAAWHYPAFAGACATGCALLVILATDAGALLPVWCLVALLPLLPLLPRLWRLSAHLIRARHHRP